MPIKKSITLTIFTALALWGASSLLANVLFNFQSLFNPISSYSLPIWYKASVLVLVVLYFVVVFQIWKLRKIGVELYTALKILEITLAFFAYAFSVSNLVISLIIVIAFWSEYKKMTSPSILINFRNPNY
jgi:hypothetical protein